MIAVRKFYVNVLESSVSITIVKEKQVRCDSVAINALLKIENAPYTPDQVAQLDDTVDLDEVTWALCNKVVSWTMVWGARTSFLTKELQSNTKIWHHFIYAQLMPTAH